MSQVQGFASCEICGSQNWNSVWSGPIRDGKFGHYLPMGLVARCGDCGIERLSESCCKDEAFYESTAYRLLVDKDASSEGFFAEHDLLQLERLNAFPPYRLRGKVVADVGCAAGAFLDHIKGLVKRAVAIEPAQYYHRSLLDRGYIVYPNLDSASAQENGNLDYCFSYSVIEHVTNPRVFLEGMRDLLRSDGELVVSTPNRSDVLMELIPEEYRPFFYRAVHRWYFDQDSLAKCADQAGLMVRSISCVHRFGLANALLWLRDKRPLGRKAIAGLDDPTLDASWRIALEKAFKGDYLYAVLSRK